MRTRCFLKSIAHTEDVQVNESRKQMRLLAPLQLIQGAQRGQQVQRAGGSRGRGRLTFYICDTTAQ